MPPCGKFNYLLNSLLLLAACIAGEVHLVGGQNEVEGRVEICFGRVWGTVQCGKSKGRSYTTHLGKTTRHLCKMYPKRFSDVKLLISNLLFTDYTFLLLCSELSRRDVLMPY